MISPRESIPKLKQANNIKDLYSSRKIFTDFVHRNTIKKRNTARNIRAMESATKTSSDGKLGTGLIATPKTKSKRRLQTVAQNRFGSGAKRVSSAKLGSVGAQRGGRSTDDTVLLRRRSLGERIKRQRQELLSTATHT